MYEYIKRAYSSEMRCHLFHTAKFYLRINPGNKNNSSMISKLPDIPDLGFYIAFQKFKIVISIKKKILLRIRYKNYVSC